MPRYKLTIEYDGGPYCGWQWQDGQMSVQQALEEAIQQFAGHFVRLSTAGRTDAGVHARGQVAHVDLEREWAPAKVREACNGILRLADHRIAVIDAELAPAGFDARFSAKKRHYLYRIIDRRPPLTLELGRAWWVNKPLDADAMHAAAQVLVGHFDFTTFRALRCQAKSPMRTLDQLDVARTGEQQIEIRASSRSFLHNQVRSMAGSLRLVGEGRWTADDLRAALEARDRNACGPVAPPDGLYLMQVDY